VLLKNIDFTFGTGQSDREDILKDALLDAANTIPPIDPNDVTVTLTPIGTSGNTYNAEITIDPPMTCSCYSEAAVPQTVIDQWDAALTLANAATPSGPLANQGFTTTSNAFTAKPGAKGRCLFGQCYDDVWWIAGAIVAFLVIVIISVGIYKLLSSRLQCCGPKRKKPTDMEAFYQNSEELPIDDFNISGDDAGGPAALEMAPAAGDVAAANIEVNHEVVDVPAENVEDEYVIE